MSKERGSAMSDETVMSIEAIHKVLLEKEREKPLGESKLSGLSDGEKLRLSKAGLGKNEFSEYRYLGYGVSEETLF
jgi:hypothetical protein